MFFGALLGALTNMVVHPNVVHTGCRFDAKRADLKTLASALESFQLDAGRYPTNLEGLAALVRQPPRSKHWIGPYIKGGQIPLDPWGHEYLYRRNGRSFTITCLGADGKPGGEEEDEDVVESG